LPKKGKEKHEKALQEKLKELETEGWKVINLHAKSPDGIAVKDEKIVAVEILQRIKTARHNPEQQKKKGYWNVKYASGYTLANKKSDYDMFDDVFFGFYEQEGYRTKKKADYIKKYGKS